MVGVRGYEGGDRGGGVEASVGGGVVGCGPQVFLCKGDRFEEGGDADAGAAAGEGRAVEEEAGGCEGHGDGRVEVLEVGR